MNAYRLDFMSNKTLEKVRLVINAESVSSVVSTAEHMMDTNAIEHKGEFLTHKFWEITSVAKQGIMPNER